ncbi:hypothetical protein [Saccharopolyspora tripterygii]
MRIGVEHRSGAVPDAGYGAQHLSGDVDWSRHAEEFQAIAELILGDSFQEQQRIADSILKRRRSTGIRRKAAVLARVLIDAPVGCGGER